MNQNEKNQKGLWFDGRELSKKDNSIIQAVYNSNYSTIILRPEQLNTFSLPSRLHIGLYINEQKEFETIKESQINKKIGRIITDDEILAKHSIKKGFKTSFHIRVDDKKSLNRAVKLSDVYSELIIEFKDPTNIPLELLIAKTQSTETIIYKIVTGSDDGWVSSMTMEKGCDGIILKTKEIQDIFLLNQKFINSKSSNFKIKELVVKKVSHAGMGDRACIDTTSALGKDEGMLIGSTAQGGILVCSETHYLPYMNTRPFRVNAGGLHSYIWGVDNQTHYLSDLAAGDRILAVKANGESRVVTIGRVKIEKRPLLLIEAETKDGSINVFIQDDWHVRVIGAKSEIRNATTIEPKDKLLGIIDDCARHVGIAIEESLTEK